MTEYQQVARMLACHGMNDGISAKNVSSATLKVAAEITS